MKKYIFSLIIISNFTNSVFGKNHGADYLIRCNEKLTEVIMEDLFTPTVASRVHMYPNIAAWEVLRINNAEMPSLKGIIKHLPDLKLAKQKINYSIAAEFAFTTVAKKLVISAFSFTDFENIEMKIWESEIKNKILISKSIAYGKEAGNKIIAWMEQDNYNKIKTMEQYVLSEKAGSWRHTAPEFINGQEPHWDLIRTLVMDSARHIIPLPNIPYSEDKSSEFYKMAQSFYKTSISIDTAKKWIAEFWDCNPNITYSKGLITYYVYKISPGGHWVKIAGQACKNLNLNESKTAEIYSLLTIGLFDGFISCWAEKYSTESMRPETYINRVIDNNWIPYIQTPPFPEYTSGHSVISNTSATILSAIIPQPYSFIDSSEMYLKIPTRSFNSFQDAADEASISRFYGGIHFMPAIVNGAKQGKEIGNFILNKYNNIKPK